MGLATAVLMVSLTIVGVLNFPFDIQASLFDIKEGGIEIRDKKGTVVKNKVLKQSNKKKLYPPRIPG